MGHYGYVRVIFLFNLSLPFPFPLCTSVQHTLPLSFCSRLWVGLKSIFLIHLLPHSLSSLPQSLCFLYQHRTPLFCTHPSLFPLLSAYILSLSLRWYQECTKRRMISGTSPSLPYVCHYDTMEDILQGRTRTQKRAEGEFFLWKTKGNVNPSVTPVDAHILCVF